MSEEKENKCPAFLALRPASHPAISLSFRQGWEARWTLTECHVAVIVKWDKHSGDQLAKESRFPRSTVQCRGEPRLERSTAGSSARKRREARWWTIQMSGMFSSILSMVG